LAARLSEDPHRSVLLLEAGPDYGPEPTNWPADLRDPGGTRLESHPWGYSAPRAAGGPAIAFPRARILGGSSTINSCLWIRGSRTDYDAWEALGNPGWGVDGLLPYFRRSEADPLAARASLHGADGPIPIFRVPVDELDAASRLCIAAAEECGWDWTDDINGSEVQQPGVGQSPRNLADGMRMNAAFTYLAAARQRPNLTIVADVLVDRVVCSENRAVAVRAADGRTFHGGEIVLTGGAHGSPAILLRSGIGPAAHLREQGISVTQDLPGVGEQLLDHPLVGPVLTHYAFADVGEPTHIPVLVKARSGQAREEIDLHLYTGQWFDPVANTWVFGLAVSLMLARSRGRVRLTAADPAATLDIDHNYFADPADLEALCDGAELAAQLAATPPLANALRRPDSLPRWQDRDVLRTLIRRVHGTTYHPSGTCKMGPASDPLAVVDHAGKVHGLEGLRVADASIFPDVVRANLHCTVVAVAEKLAEAIREGE
jgi:choline dehydrogenase